eukprot:TRINITY_DN124675_c0_g1_i1.p1 TRINITY_DN124675_c0_g1~~TRINITY_DN124675_c0_g1_i1.p1  ORF type:complete len:172 (-),score=52.11 TRINITY_DN124675_c0_g1_i1:231-746(-)
MEEGHSQEFLEALGMLVRAVNKTGNLEDLKVARTKVAEIFNNRIHSIEAEMASKMPPQDMTVMVMAPGGDARDFEGLRPETLLSALVERVEKDFGVQGAQLTMAKHTFADTELAQSLSKLGIADGAEMHMRLPKSADDKGAERKDSGGYAAAGPAFTAMATDKDKEDSGAS